MRYNNATYYVLNGHTLGYVFDAEQDVFGVLASKPQLGGLDWFDGPVTLTPSDSLKEATEEDFKYFRVVPPVI